MSIPSEHNIEKKRPFDDIVERIKKALAVSSDAAVGRAFGFERQTVTGWRTNGIPEKTVFRKLEHVRADWILSGEGPMNKGELGRDEESKQYEEFGRMMAEAIDYGVKKGIIGKTGTNKQEKDSTADCRLPTADCHAQTDDRPFVMPPPRQEAGPSPFDRPGAHEAFRQREAGASPARRNPD